MRITYFHQYFNTPDMPGSTRSFEMARRLVTSGHEVTMITSRRDKHQQENIGLSNEDGIQVVWLPVAYSNHMSFLRRIISFLLFSIRATLKGKKIKADLIFASSTPLTIAIPAVWVSKMKKIPMVFEVRDLWPEIPIAVGALKSKFSIFLARKLERWTYKNSKRVIALSNGMKDGVLKQGYAEDNISVITNISDIPRFSVPREEGVGFRSKFDWLDQNPLVLYAGALGRVNGVDYLIRVAKEMILINPYVRFLIAGEGFEEINIKNLSKELGVYNTNVFFSNPIPKEDIPAVFSAATVSASLFIDLDVLWHNSANKFFDALAAGRPVMINYEGWQKEVLETTGAGLIVPPNDPVTAAKSLGELLADDSKLKSMGHSAKNVAINNFSIENLYRKFENTLISAMKEYEC